METEQDFEQDVITTDIHGNNFRAVALLDTGCHHGNWISKRLVQDLGKLCEISPAPSTTTAHKKNKKGDKSAIAAEKERQRKEKAALKEWRKQAKQGDSSQEASQQFVQYQEDEVQG
ncbi:hypothetical protein GQ53DRAFT_760523 [Thozetella sp. PMI_491]|nr:hypothetical protein GQ53DRAFT_760523 [Thozetella sp. PMI_491]